jgi:methyl-accepting chemotaxis protein
VAEIATASSEQAQGISQVNTAVNEVDKVTQQNAANAEESASASEEMNAQAEQMKVYVAELVAMVGSSKNGRTSNGAGNTVKQQHQLAKNHPSPHMPLHVGTNGNGKGPQKGNGKAKLEMPAGVMNKTSPEKMIPLDDDFKDF